MWSSDTNAVKEMTDAQRKQAKANFDILYNMTYEIRNLTLLISTKSNRNTVMRFNFKNTRVESVNSEWRAVELAESRDIDTARQTETRYKVRERVYRERWRHQSQNNFPDVVDDDKIGADFDHWPEDEHRHGALWQCARFDFAHTCTRETCDARERENMLVYFSNNQKHPSAVRMRQTSVAHLVTGITSCNSNVDRNRLTMGKKRRIF